jgi:endonuclease/exonuclease/phosphatase family metal-dependent hydrolase
MRKISGFVTFAVPLVLLSAAAAAGIWFRSVETPPWESDRPASGKIETPSEGHIPDKEDAVLTPFTFITYNVKNWLTSNQSPEKSPESKEAIIALLADGKPDVIGLSEIGSKNDVVEICGLLREAGTDLPHIHHTGGADAVRHLAILSRFPIISVEQPDLDIPGTDQSMQRGILDVTLSVGGRPVRFLGLHLKSKRIVPEFDEALLRVQEAGHVRNHIDGILAANPSALLVAYGDFNDTTRSLSTRIIYGTYRTPGYMNPIHVKDSRGETWTHRYQVQDSYSRIDFVTVSSAMRRHVKKTESRIIDGASWDIASDHRPVLIRFE